jgi:hypothetical protein
MTYSRKAQTSTQGGAQHITAPRPLVAFSSALGRYLPELRLQIQLVHALYEATNVVAKYLTKRLISLRRLRAAPQLIPGVRFGDAEAILLMILACREI